jgi:hypothetical protein
VKLLLWKMIGQMIGQVSHMLSVGHVHAEMHRDQQVGTNRHHQLGCFTIGEVADEPTPETEVVAAVNGQQGNVHMQSLEPLNQTIIWNAVA